MTLEGQTLEERVEEIVIDVLSLRYDLPRPRGKTTSNSTCDTCGTEHEQNFDYRGEPNGYRTHQLGTCIETMRGEIEALCDRILYLESVALRRSE